MVDLIEGSRWVQNNLESSLVVEVKEKQHRDPILFKLNEVVWHQKVEFFYKGGDGILYFQESFYVLCVDSLRQQILAEAHDAQYFIHLGATMIYCDLYEIYWWSGIKKDIPIISRLRLRTKGLVVYFRSSTSLLGSGRK